jgi:hypothetical protein
MKIHETNVLDNLFSNEMVDDASNPNKNILFTNAKNIEPYNTSYANPFRSNNKKYKLLTHNVSKQIDEFMACKEFHLHMRQLNNEQETIVDDILYKKPKNPTKPFHIFLTRGVGTRKTFILTCIIPNML